MRAPILSVLAIGILSGCATGPKPPTYKRDYAPVDAKEFKYEDRNIQVVYTPVTFESGVPVIFVNKTDKPIKVIWDETSFINPSGWSEKVIHEGVKIIDRNAPMAPSMIPPKASLVDSVTPTSRIFWSGSSWAYLMICGEQKLIPFQGYEQKDEECLGKSYGLFVTYEIDGKKNSFSIKYKMIGRSQNEALPK